MLMKRDILTNMSTMHVWQDFLFQYLFLNVILNRFNFRLKSGPSYPLCHLKNCKNWKRRLVLKCIKKRFLEMPTRTRSVDIALLQKFSNEKIRIDHGRWARRNLSECYRRFLLWRKKKSEIQGIVIIKGQFILMHLKQKAVLSVNTWDVKAACILRYSLILIPHSYCL